MERVEEPNPCLSCGACCAYFRILLNWTEIAESGSDGGIPEELTVWITEYLRVMRGTDRPPIRCAALIGEVGTAVRCSIYDRRCAMCREFSPRSEDGSPNEACAEARAAYHLPPLPSAFDTSSS